MVAALRHASTKHHSCVTDSDCDRVHALGLRHGAALLVLQRLSDSAMILGSGRATRPITPSAIRKPTNSSIRMRDSRRLQRREPLLSYACWRAPAEERYSW